ncbi:MAG TPA: hypothetical protein VLK29_01860, partial [Luteimonas sp.]|nr:hypothetical protein [Luteimonas sp.]
MKLDPPTCGHQSLAGGSSDFSAWCRPMQRATIASPAKSASALIFMRHVASEGITVAGIRTERRVRAMVTLSGVRASRGRRRSAPSHRHRRFWTRHPPQDRFQTASAQIEPIDETRQYGSPVYANFSPPSWIYVLRFRAHRDNEFPFFQMRNPWLTPPIETMPPPPGPPTT